MVHETKSNHKSWRGSEARLSTYFRVQVVDKLDGCLEISSMYRLAYLDPFVDAAEIGFWLNIRFRCKLLCGGRVAFGDQIVHDQIVHITVDDA